MTDSTETLFLKARSLGEFESAVAPLFGEMSKQDAAITARGQGLQRWPVAGYCAVCARPSSFWADWQFSDNQTPNYRERLICDSCGLNNRQRFTMALLKQIVDGRHDLKIYLYEQVTAFFHQAQGILAGHRVVGSEYLGFDKAPGQEFGGIRHENATRLSFRDASLDLLISNDVLEHVPGYRQALQESSRVLKPGGKMLFSIPFYLGEQTTRIRAVEEQGSIRHVQPPQYHGNPVSAEGSLVFNDFGWDVIEQCLAAGFKEAYAIFYHSTVLGYLGTGLMQFVAKNRYTT
jgi:SAM-dependent methyltransferase